MLNWIPSPIKRYFSLCAHPQKGSPVLVDYLNLQIFAETVWALLKLFSSLAIERLNKQRNEWKIRQANAKKRLVVVNIHVRKHFGKVVIQKKAFLEY